MSQIAKANTGTCNITSIMDLRLLIKMPPSKLITGDASIYATVPQGTRSDSISAHANVAINIVAAAPKKNNALSFAAIGFLAHRLVAVCHAQMIIAT